jgi:Ser/Thr protein kinase RdoA (MazF antagonist)
LPLAQHIETVYPLEIRTMTKIRDVYRLQSAKGLKLCVKHYPIPEPEVRFIAEVLIQLAEAGFEYGPRIVKTRSQTLWATRNNKAYMITNWVRGRSPDMNVQAEWKKAVRTLAEFHQYAELPKRVEVPSERDRFERLPNLIADYRSLLLQDPALSKRSDCVSLCDEAIRHLGEPDSVEAIKQEASLKAIVHGDYNYPNLVRDRKGNVHLIDFENTSLQARMTDLAHILHRNAAWKGNKTLRWIEYYDHFRPLSSQDRHLLYALLHVPYPIVRAIQLHKDIKKISNTMPKARTIDQYVSCLSNLI